MAPARKRSELPPATVEALAAEIADMSGQIWDHLPEMIHHFEEEGLPYPTFKQGEMADLVAFLHSGKGKISLPPLSEIGGRNEQRDLHGRRHWKAGDTTLGQQAGVRSGRGSASARRRRAMPIR